MFGRISAHWRIKVHIEKSFRKLFPVHYFENIAPGINHCDWLILVIGLLYCFNCVIKLISTLWSFLLDIVESRAQSKFALFFLSGISQTTITGMNKLDIPSSKAYFLGLPKRQNKPSTNFVGCIRYLTVDGYEPIVKAWAGNRDSSIVKGSMRPCTASDEMQS